MHVAMILVMEILFLATIDLIKSNDDILLSDESSDIEKSPYLASIRLREGDKHKCAATALSYQMLITAAHCVLSVSPSDLIVVMGVSDLKEKSKSQNYFVEDIFIHRLYMARTSGNDIALLFTTQPIKPNKFVGFLKSNDRWVRAETPCRAYGWGQFEKTTQSNTKLVSASLPIVSFRRCHTKYHKLPSKVICAGYQDIPINTCQGDSGGPLVCKNKLVGITSFSGGCGEGYPTVYTDVRKFLDWIDDMWNTFNGISALRALDVQNVILVTTLFNMAFRW